MEITYVSLRPLIVLNVFRFYFTRKIFVTFNFHNNRPRDFPLTFTTNSNF